MIYLVYESIYGDTYLVTACTTEELAEETVAALQEKHSMRDYWVETASLDLDPKLIAEND